MTTEVQGGAVKEKGAGGREVMREEKGKEIFGLAGALTVGAGLSEAGVVPATVKGWLVAAGARGRERREKI